MLFLHKQTTNETLHAISSDTKMHMVKILFKRGGIKRLTNQFSFEKSVFSILYSISLLSTLRIVSRQQSRSAVYLCPVFY